MNSFEAIDRGTQFFMVGTRVIAIAFFYEFYHKLSAISITPHRRFSTENEDY
ncbi:hypothetical protein NDI47_22160 [Microcoleus vaginatus GB1-A2]|uniref:hypothetical protein n=1 Tax=Microcoleus vaginatus TaxID=119532 RepID=UPI001686F046|nr:hypothetical protein [Microcoleus sp. FACHB-61]